MQARDCIKASRRNWFIFRSKPSESLIHSYANTAGRGKA